MKKRGIKIGEIEKCPKCNLYMERRERAKPPDLSKMYYYREWDYCKPCGHIQHYEHYKVYN